MKGLIFHFAVAVAAAVIVCAGAPALSVTENGGIRELNVNTNTDAILQIPYSAPVQTAENEPEMRAVWLPYMSLQLSEDERSREGFEKKISYALDRCMSCGANTVIVHARPFGDALYPSELYPWSHILSGEQGRALSFDPLKIIVSEAHARGLAVHAWINPLRISTGSTPAKLSEDNPYIKWNGSQEDFFEYNKGIYYDPSSARSRRLVIDGVRELVRGYDIDGVQIDDYFYPEEITEHDRLIYRKYLSSLPEGSKALSAEDWRKNNINMLVAGMYDAAHSTDKNIVFGISPQCNFDNNERISADIRSWCTLNGYADYICPQIYITDEHPVFSFTELTERWRAEVTNGAVRLYVGLGLYKAGTDADGGSWQGRDDNLAKQICTLREKGADGFMLYSYEQLDAPEAAQELKNLISVI